MTHRDRQQGDGEQRADCGHLHALYSKLVVEQHRLETDAWGQTVHQDARLYIGTLDAGEDLTHRLGDDRHAWVQMVRGAVLLNGTPLRGGDGAAVSKEAMLQIYATTPAELLLFDLA